jgi:TonB family protein
VITSARLPLAIGASLLLHGALIGSLQALPGALRISALPDEHSGAMTLHASFRVLAPAAEPAPLARPSSAAVARAMPASPAKELQQAAPVGEPKLGIGPMYYPAHLLDERPQVRTHIEPRFPDSVEVPGGRVVLHLYINELGTVDEVVITESEPAGLFEAAAAEAFGAGRFRPGHKAGVAVKSRVAIEVTFGVPVPVGPAAAINGGQYE